MARRVIMRIELTPTAKNLLADLCQRNGMTQVAVMSRITEWFSSQTELIQAAVLGQYPSVIESDVAKLILKKMAGGKSKRAADGQINDASKRIAPRA